MFRELGWFSVPNRMNFNKAVYTYRAMNDLAPEYSHINFTETGITSTYSKLMINPQWIIVCTKNHVRQYTMDRFLVQRLGYGPLFLRQ